MPSTDSKIKFPLWQFLTQAVFDSSNKAELNPQRFAYIYRLQLLERCWYQAPASKDRHCS